jgi:hypothetical protein
MRRAWRQRRALAPMHHFAHFRANGNPAARQCVRSASSSSRAAPVISLTISAPFQS